MSRRLRAAGALALAAALGAVLWQGEPQAPPSASPPEPHPHPAASNPSNMMAPRYRDILPVFWDELYGDGGESLYCGEAFGAQRDRDLNVEHVFPMAWVMNKFGCRDRDQCRDHAEFRRIEADLHNLYPARRDLNAARGSFPFAIIPGEPRAFGDCDFEVDQRRRWVEPRPAVRGEIARAMFYMHDTYDLEIRRRQAWLLLQWNREDPPGELERRRNAIIERLQGRRNRFIDAPRSADALVFP